MGFRGAKAGYEFLAEAQDRSTISEVGLERQNGVWQNVFPCGCGQERLPSGGELGVDRHQCW